MSIAVSIVSYNTKDFLNNCLKILSNQKIGEKINIWVLDNNSKDGSAQMVEEKFPDVKLIRSNINLGFAKGQNQILKQVKDKYVLILNPDTEFEQGSLGAMVNFMEENPECGVAGGKLTDFNNNLESNGGNFPFGLALYSWLFNLEFLGVLPSFHRNDKEYYSGIQKVDWVSGTFMIIRTEIFKKVGFFNEDFFMYFEDTEFCYRVKKMGGKIMLNTNVAINHRSGSSSKDPRFTQWTGEFKGLIKFYNMYIGFFGAFYARMLVYLAIILRIIAFLFKGKSKKSLTYAKVLVSI